MRRICALMLALCLALGLAGCGSSSTASTSGSGDKRIVSVATTQPENHPISVGLRAMQDYINEKRGDKVEVKIYYNSIMGDNSQALELLQMGTLNLVATSGSNLESFSDVYKIFGVPYLFSSEENFRKCMNTPEFIQQIYDCTKDKGLEGVAWFANGVNNIYSTTPIYTPDDLKGKKFRVQSSEANVMLVQAWGAAATILSYGEVYTALQNHVIDCASNPEMALVNMKHGEVAPYYSRTEHQIFTDMLVANVDFLNSLNDEEKPVFEEAFKIATEKECEEWDKQIQDCIVQAKEMGVEFIDVDKEPFEKLAEPVKEKLLSNPALQSLYPIVQKIQGE